jgi:FAD/FMN-containing dehydrogenase
VTTSPAHQPPISTSSVSPAVCSPIGVDAHTATVERILTDFSALPEGAPVRLAKRTSNLFRTRSSPVGGLLDTSGLDGVVSVDEEAATASVQGMCTYEHLVAATLPHGFMPLVVPQLRTITLGGAVTGLGIESTSFRNGLPHESVVDLDILTGAGDVVTASATGAHGDLFAAFPNSYGTLGYALRLTVRLERIRPYIALRNLRFDDLDSALDAVRTVAPRRVYEGEPVDFLDGVVFSAHEIVLVMGRWTDDPGESGPSDYTGQSIYYRSLRERRQDLLTTHDFLWRWDTDWFWCSAAFGAQNPLVRRVWPARYRRSDVYHRLVGLDSRFAVAARLDRLRGRPARERVIQDVEIPVERTADFLRWFLAEVGMSPVWVCPLRLLGRGGGPADRPWPLYPIPAGETFVNVGFWGTVPVSPDEPRGVTNRKIEHAVDGFRGHKSLYSDAYYSPEEFRARYGGEEYDQVKRTYDPSGRLLDLYTKAVRGR